MENKNSISTLLSDVFKNHQAVWNDSVRIPHAIGRILIYSAIPAAPQVKKVKSQGN